MAAALVLLGCPSTYLREVTFSKQSEAGSVHVAVQSVAPFEEYIDSLQPRFDLSSVDALQKAIPETRLREVVELRALAATLKVALSQINVSDTGTETRQAGDTGKLTAPPQASLPTITPFALPTADALQLDPTLQYEAAASLYQEVALLSSYVRDAAVTKDQVPYFVRLLITSLPRARVSPYDFYATVSFFERPQQGTPEYGVHGSKSWKQLAAMRLTPEEDKRLSELAKWKTPPAKDRGELERLKLRAAAQVSVDSIQKAVDEQLKDNKCGTGRLGVIPLFSTVRYEASLESTAQASRTDLGLSLGGSLGTVGVGAGAGSTADDQQRALYRAINTPFSVARITDNTLQVRLGAVFAGTKTGYVTPAQQYFLTALILLRRTALQEVSRADSYLLDLLPCPAVSYVAQTSIRDVKKGVELGREDPKAVLQTKLAILLPSHRAETERLAETVLSGDDTEFARALGEKDGICSSECRPAWADAVALSSSMGRSVGSFTVPDRYFRFFSNAAKAAVVDDGNAATLTISDSLANVTAAGILATLRLQSNKNNETLFYTVHPKSVTVDSSGRTAIVTFPSASSVCPPDSEKEKEPSSCKVTEASLRWGRPLSRWYNAAGVDYWDWTCPDPNPDPATTIPGMKTRAECLSVSVTKPPSVPPAASISMPGGRVVLTPPDAGSFSVILRLPSQPAKGTETPPKIPVAFTLEGADVTTVTGAHLLPRDTFWLVDGDTVLMVSVKNAVVGGTIRVKATSLDAKQRPLSDPKATTFQDIIVIAPPQTQQAAKDKN